MSVTTRILPVLAALLLAAPPLWAAGPLASVQQPIEQVIRILKDPAFAGEAQKDAQRERIWRHIEQVFDFERIGRLAVARHWKKFSAQEKEEFTAVFADLLGRTYLDRIQSGFTNESVVFDDEKMRGEKKAVVASRIIRQAGDIPVDYSLFLSKSGWRVYDVSIEGVSLVKNYRTQFNQILAKEPPRTLIQRLREKVQETACQSGGPDAGLRLGMALGLLYHCDVVRSRRKTLVPGG